MTDVAEVASGKEEDDKDDRRIGREAGATRSPSELHSALGQFVSFCAGRNREARGPQTMEKVRMDRAENQIFLSASGLKPRLWHLAPMDHLAFKAA